MTLDGTNNVNMYQGSVNSNVAVDAVQEFKVQSGTMSAEHGYTAGGVVNMVTKSGTNEFHGTLYEFLRNDKLDARNTFAAVKAPYRYNQYGCAIGGPVIRNRTFFFFNFEEWRFRQSYTAIGTTPTDAERGGDFSNLRDARGNLIPIFDPQTTVANPSGSGFVRTAFANNTIPASRFDKVAVNILPFYPKPNRQPTNAFTHSNNFLTNLGAEKQAKQATAKIDHRFSSFNSFSFRYVVSSHKDDNGATAGDRAGATPGIFPDPLNRVRNDNFSNRNFSLTDTHFFSSHLIHDFRASVARLTFPFTPASVGGDWPRKLGLPASVPSITFPGINPLPGTPGFPAGFGLIYGSLTSDAYQLMDSVTWIKGKHTLKAGVEFRRGLYNDTRCSACSGEYVFNERLTGNPQGLAGTGSSLASLLLGSVASATIDSNVGTSQLGYSQAYYVQDDWKISRRLTLNLGLRYDYQQVPLERHDGFSNFNPAAINPETKLLGRLEFAGKDFGRSVINPDYNDFSPRVGFALDVFGTGKTVVRGGYGVYYPLTFAFAAGFGARGFRGNSTAYGPQGGNSDLPAFRLQDGLPFPYVQPLGAAIGPSAFLSQAVTYDEPNGRTPYSQQFTFTLQHQLPGGYLLETSYSGNKGTKLRAGTYDLNQLDPQYLSLGSNLLNQVPNPYQGRVPGAFGGATITRQQSLRPYPYYANITVQSPHMGSSTYHSFLLNVEKRMSNGLVMLASYTYSKLISNGVTGLSFSGTLQRNSQDYQNGKFDLARERALDGGDSPQRFVLSSIYELPFGSKKRWHTSNGFVNVLIGGWQVDGVLVFESGLPLIIRGANNFLSTRPNSTGVSPKLDNPTAAQWFDTSQFVNPPNFAFGNVGRTLPDARSPGVLNLDFSVIKNIQIREGFKLQLRGEAFNVANHANLLPPDT
ncbi:MAG: TonB-dependent receptor, partial [Bryobacteraceae bacterium]